MLTDLQYSKDQSWKIPQQNFKYSRTIQDLHEPWVRLDLLNRTLTKNWQQSNVQIGSIVDNLHGENGGQRSIEYELMVVALKYQFDRREFSFLVDYGKLLIYLVSLYLESI